MKLKTITISVLALLLALGFILWWTARVVSRKRAPPVKRYITAPVVKKKPPPKVAIVMDDFGYNMNNLDEFFSIKRPITLSILPNLTYSTKIAQLGRTNGYEVILHLPLEPHREDIPEEVDTIN